MSLRHHLKIRVYLQVTADQVEAVLMDFERYSQSNSLFASGGSSALGQTLSADLMCRHWGNSGLNLRCCVQSFEFKTLKEKKCHL